MRLLMEAGRMKSLSCIEGGCERESLIRERDKWKERAEKAESVKAALTAQLSTPKTNKFVAFHGTRTKEQYEQILAVGIRKGAYFAFHVHDALVFGGDYLFCVEFETGTWRGEPDGWQFRTRDWVDAKRIAWHGRVHRRIYPAPIENPLAIDAAIAAEKGKTDA